ncbi:hypothetical protein METHB2_560020 [Candidatus Methylobacter favarea]|uniref:Uncharacterized protein n=1 Tax=Candidatus Methylobacter favarea TaxID=2707345 RepID=A0A8S0Y6S1_9GAMM|nr:hypothetical protein METHB2_560020 [Candidatus Methylobacter favarea]
MNRGCINSPSLVKIILLVLLLTRLALVSGLYTIHYDLTTRANDLKEIMLAMQVLHNIL